MTLPNVLVVEDNEANRDMLSRRLARRGWMVEIAVDGRQGLEMATARLPGIILMDMSLPEMSGWELTRILKKDPTTREIPIIALTAHAMPNDLEEALRAGCDDFETKPVDLNQLLEKMMALIDRSRAHVERS